ncbi:MAG: DMT family transporter [Microbacteriaceae bacterium]
MNKNGGSRIPRPFSYALAFIAGLAMSLQAHINGELGVALGSGIVAATLSFSGGVILLGVATLASHSIRSGLRSIRRAIATKQTSWMFTLAGAAGAAFVLSQSTVAPVLGLGTFTVAFVCGLTVGGLVMDRFGI